MTQRGATILRTGKYAAALGAVVALSLVGRSLDRAVAVEPAIRENNAAIAKIYVPRIQFDAAMATRAAIDVERDRRLSEIAEDVKHTRSLLEAMILNRQPAPGWRARK